MLKQSVIKGGYRSKENIDVIEMIEVINFYYTMDGFTFQKQ